MIKSVLWPDSNHDQTHAACLRYWVSMRRSFDCKLRVLLIAIEKSEHVCMRFPMVAFSQ